MGTPSPTPVTRLRDKSRRAPPRRAAVLDSDGRGATLRRPSRPARRAVPAVSVWPQSYSRKPSHEPDSSRDVFKAATTTSTLRGFVRSRRRPAVAKTVGHHVLHDTDVHVVVAVHEHVAEAGHPAERLDKRFADPAPRASRSNNSRCVRGSPRRRSETMWDATSRAAWIAIWSVCSTNRCSRMSWAIASGRASVRSWLTHVLDNREALGKQFRVGHADARGRRYSLRIGSRSKNSFRVATSYRTRVRASPSNTS